MPEFSPSRAHPILASGSTAASSPSPHRSSEERTILKRCVDDVAVALSCADAAKALKPPALSLGERLVALRERYELGHAHRLGFDSLYPPNAATCGGDMVDCSVKLRSAGATKEASGIGVGLLLLRRGLLERCRARRWAR